MSEPNYAENQRLISCVDHDNVNLGTSVQVNANVISIHGLSSAWLGCANIYILG